MRGTDFVQTRLAPRAGGVQSHHTGLGCSKRSEPPKAQDALPLLQVVVCPSCLGIFPIHLGGSRFVNKSLSILFYIVNPLQKRQRK